MSDEKIKIPKTRCLNPHRLKVSVSVPAFSVNLLHTAPRVSTQVDGFPIVSQQSFPAYDREDYIYNTTTGTGNTPVFRYNPANAPGLSWPTPEGNRYSRLGLTITQSSAVTNIINVVTLQLICAAPRPKFRRYIEFKNYLASDPTGTGRNISYSRVRYEHIETMGYGQSIIFGTVPLQLAGLGQGTRAEYVAINQWGDLQQLQDGNRVFANVRYWNDPPYNAQQYFDSGFGPEDKYLWNVIDTTIDDTGWVFNPDGVWFQNWVNRVPVAPRTGPLAYQLNSTDNRFAGIIHPIIFSNGVNDTYAGAPNPSNSTNAFNRANLSTPISQVPYDYTTGTYYTPYSTVKTQLSNDTTIVGYITHLRESPYTNPTQQIVAISRSHFYARTGQAGLTDDNFEFNGSNLVKWEVVVGAWEHFEHVADHEDDYDFDATLSATWSKSLTHSIDYTQDTDFDFVFDMSINTNYGLSITQSVMAKVTIHAVTEDDY